MCLHFFHRYLPWLLVKTKDPFKFLLWHISERNRWPPKLGLFGPRLVCGFVVRTAADKDWHSLTAKG